MKTTMAVKDLNEILGYSYCIPDAPITRSVRADEDEPWCTGTYIERQKTIAKNALSRRKDGLSEGEEAVIKVVRNIGRATGVDVASNTSWTRNHCSMLLTSLFRKGKLGRSKERSNGTRWYVYYLKDGS